MNIFAKKKTNTPPNSHIFKRKRHHDNDTNSEHSTNYKKMKLIEDFERLSLNSQTPSQSRTNFNISINIPNNSQNNNHILYKEILQHYHPTDRNWEVAISVNWGIFWHFIFLHNNNPNKKHIKIKNILWWLSQVGIPRGVDVWNYYYFDSYEKPQKRYYKVPQDVEMEL